MSDFTPGPWRSGVDGNLRVYGPDYLGQQSGLIASFVRRADVTLVTSAPELLAACRAHHAWSYAERHGLGSFDQRSALCAHAESLTARAIAMVDDQDVPAYRGTKKLIVWPEVTLAESTQAEAEALVAAVFEHQSAASDIERSVDVS